MPGDDVQLKREIAIATDAGDGAFMLLELRVHEELGRLFRIEAVVRAQRANINLDSLLGTNATARVTVKQGAQRYFNGIISRISRSGEKNTELDYTLVIVPQIWLATRTTDCTIAQNMTVPAIVKEYLEHYDVVVDDQLKGTYRSWEYCVQYRESDFNFISRLMEQEGISYFFEHKNGAHTMVLCDDPLSHKPLPNTPEVEFFPPNPDMPPPANTLSDWTFDADLESASVALNDFDFKAPTKNLKTTRGVEVPGISANREVFDHPGEYTEVADGEVQVRVRAEEIATYAMGWSGSGTCRDIYAGATFKLKDSQEALRQGDRGEYLVISSTLVAIQNLDESGSGGGGSVSCSLRSIKSDRPFRPNRSTPKPVIPGPQTAMVVGPEGQELQVDEFGRVRVRFMWDRYGTEKPEDSSAWIRVSQPWSGKGYGAMFIPRAGHEVIVEFLEGDPDRPIITGRVYNFDNKVPYALPANKTISTIRTDSSPHSGGYHEIRFEDKDGSEQLMIHAQRRMDLTVRANLYESVGGNREETVGKDDKGDHNTLVCGDTNDHRKKGAYFKVEEVVHKTVLKDVIEDFQTKQTTKVTKRYTLNAEEIVEESSSAFSVKSDKITIQGSSGVHLKAGKVCIEGTQCISLKVGGNFVVIDASGVSIKGTMVNINSGGSPQSAEAPLSMDSVTIEEPLDALKATTAVPGAASRWKLGGFSRSRAARGVQLLKAPPLPPPPPPPKPPTQTTEPPVQPESDKPCGIKSLQVHCGHDKKRVPGPGNILRIVPTPTQFKKFEYENKFKVMGEGAFTISGTKKWGGSDRLEAKVEIVDEGKKKRVQTALVSTGGPPSDSDWKATDPSKQYNVDAQACEKFWLGNVRPRVLTLYGRGCDDVMQSITIEVYPSEVYEGSVGIKVFESIAKRINGWLEDHCEKTWGDVKLGVKVEGPSGEFTVGWSWGEEKDWQAAFSAYAKPSFTLFGITAYAKWNVRDTAIRLGLNALGVPPPVTEAIMKLKEEYANSEGANGEKRGDPLDNLLSLVLELTLSGKPVLKGDITKKWLADQSEGQWSGSASVVGEIELKLALRLEIGKEDFWVYAKAEGSVATGIKPTIELALEKDGLYGYPKLMFPGVTFKVSVQLKVYKIKGERGGEWSPIPEKQLLPDPDSSDPPKWHLAGGES